MEISGSEFKFQDVAYVGDLSVQGTLMNTIDTCTTISNISDINYQNVDGSYADRFKNYNEFVEKWSNPDMYLNDLVDNPNDIQKVINPTTQDYITALKHGARPEFIKVSKEDLENYVLANPHEFF